MARRRPRRRPLAFGRRSVTVAGAPQREGASMNERLGVAVAILSCSFGAGAAVATRYLIGGADPITIAAIRFGGGALCLWPLALALRVAWPRGRDRIAVAALGVLFFAVFFVFYNLALRYTGARHARALDAAADDHGGGRGARHRGFDGAQDRRRPHRDRRRRRSR